MASYWTVHVRVDMAWFEEHALRHARGEGSDDDLLPEGFKDHVWTCFRDALGPMLLDCATAALGKGIDGPETRLPGCKRGAR